MKRRDWWTLLSAIPLLTGVGVGVFAVCHSLSGSDKGCYSCAMNTLEIALSGLVLVQVARLMQWWSKQ